MEWYKIPNVSFAAYVECLMDIYKTKEPTSDIYDPFLEAITSGLYNVTTDQHQKNTRRFQLEHSMKMKMGGFHQKLLSAFPGWKNLKQGDASGVDVVKEDESEYAEIKNRTNTMNSGSAKTVNDKLVKQVALGRKAILVQINTGLDGKTNTSGIDKSIHIMNGKEAYAYFSGNSHCYDLVLYTVNETFKRFKTWREICEFRDQQLQRA